MRNVLIIFVLSLFTLFPVTAMAQSHAPSHAIAMHGDPKYGPDFTHFEYVNPDAPKGVKEKQALAIDAAKFDEGQYAKASKPSDPAVSAGKRGLAAVLERLGVRR